MTELAPTSTTELVQPLSGELVPADDVAGLARALAALREHRDRVNDAIAMFTAAAAEESARQGTRTLTADGWEIKLGPDTEINWDMEVLLELRTAGLPEDRFDQLVRATVEYKVDGRVVRQLEAASPVYAEIIDRARSRVPKRQYASVPPRRA